MTPEINVRKELANTSHYKEKDVLQTRYPKIPLSKTSPPFTAEKLSSLKQHITQETTSAQQGRAHALQPHQSPLLSLLLPEALRELSRKEPLYPASCCTNSEPSGGLCAVNRALGSTMQCYSALLTSLGVKYAFSSFSETKASETQGAQRPFSKTKPKMATGPWRISGCTSGRARYLRGFSHPGQLSTG